MERTQSLSSHRGRRQPSRPPMKHRPFCSTCPKTSNCRCGESDDAIFEWEFSPVDKTRSSHVYPDRSIQFHPCYSIGTAACKGTTALVAMRHHFWELRMTSPMYGTDVMIGVATKDFNILQYESSFVSMLGKDEKSWGFSYQGYKYHSDVKTESCSSHCWGEGSIVGVHLDRWRGTIEFYLNRKPLGISFTNVPPEVELFPVITSTAAKSSMRLLCAQSSRCDLAFECVRALSRSRIETRALPFSSNPCVYVQNEAKKIFDHLPPGITNFVDKQCWYLLGARVKNIFEEKLRDDDDSWTMLSTDDEMDQQECLSVSKKRSTSKSEIVDAEISSSEDENLLFGPKVFSETTAVAEDPPECLNSLTASKPLNAFVVKPLTTSCWQQLKLNQTK